VSDELSHTLAGGNVPNVGCAVKGARDYFVSEGVVERECVDYVVVAHEGVELLGVLGVVEPAGAVLGSRDEAGAVLVEAHVGEGQVVALNHFVLVVGLVAGVFLLVYQFQYQFL